MHKQVLKKWETGQGKKFPNFFLDHGSSSLPKDQSKDGFTAAAAQIFGEAKENAIY